MKLNSSRAKQIDGYLKSHGEAKTDEKLKVLYGGDLKVLDVYRIPIKYLVFNIRNGRFKAELLEKEEEFGRRLDSTTKEDANIIRDLLLKQDLNATELLEADLKKNGQRLMLAL